jgi:glucosyl-dolichyl phosphate glucuronosyltransferase
MIKLTAAICTCDRYRVLGQAIASLRDQTLTTDAYQILVVDNSLDVAAADRFSESLAGISNLRYLRSNQLGLSHARNLALAETATPYVAFIDDDAIAERDWLANIAAFFDANDASIAAVGGPAEPIWEAPRPPWLHDELLGYLGLLDLGGARLEIEPHQWLIGTNIAFRREALLEVGGFRTDLGRRGNLLLSNEELELQQRLRAAGGRVVYCPNIRVRHRVARERLTRHWMRQRIFWQAISDLVSDPTPRLAANLPPTRLRLFNRETNNPKRFHRQCRRLSKALESLARGERAA